MERTGTDNPLSFVDVGNRSDPAFVDCDHDGDFDLFVGEFYGGGSSGGATLFYFENTGSAGSPAFVERTGTDNPLSLVDVDFSSTPAFADLDADADDDAFVGHGRGAIEYFRNDGEPSLPVELTQLTALVEEAGVLLRWQTSSETNNAGFEVQHRSGADWQALGFVEGQGTSTVAHTYRYRAEGLPPGRHHFRLKQVDFDGNVAFSPEVEVVLELAGAYEITPAFPNPFNPQARFTLTVKQRQDVRVVLYDVLGRAVKTLFEGPVSAEEARQIIIDGADLPSGVYLYEVQGQTFREVHSVMLVK